MPMQFASLLLSAALILLATLPTGAAESRVHPEDWPLPALLISGLTPLHAQPDANSDVIATLHGPTIAGDESDVPEEPVAGWCRELTVTSRSVDAENRPWIRVQCDQLQGWVAEDRISPDETASPVTRLGVRVRGDYGPREDLAVALFGPPMSQSTRTMHIPDFNHTVGITTLAFHGHEAEYWDQKLRVVTITGGFADFGGISPGLSVQELSSALGTPHHQTDTLWGYHHELDEFEFTILGDSVTGMRYRRAVFE